MGLDINVYRPVQTDAGLSDGMFFIANLEIYPELEVFKDFICLREEESYDLESACHALGEDLEGSECIGVFHEEDSVIFEFQDKSGRIFELIDPPTALKTFRVIFCADEGHQSDGANQRFYEDGMDQCVPILLKETLINHWETYFSYETSNRNSYAEVSDGLASERHDRFKKNIIDNFIEGETFVLYH